MAKELTIPERLALVLALRKVSQNALARVAKISPQTVANTLHHGRVPQSKTTAKIAKTLGVPPSVFSMKSMTDDRLRSIVATNASSWSFVEGTTAVRKPASKTTAKRKPAAKKTTTTKRATVKKATTTAKKAVAKKPVAKKMVAKKAVAKKTVAKKTVAKKAVARKPIAKKAVAKKTVAKKAVARKPVAKKTVAKKPVARKATTARKATAARKTTGTRTVVRHTTKATKRPTTGTNRTTTRKSTIARKGATTRPTRGAAISLNGSIKGIDFDALVLKLQKLANSRSEQVSLDACKALLSLR